MMDEDLMFLGDETPDFSLIANQQQVQADLKKGGSIGINRNRNNKLKPGKFSDASNPLEAPWLLMGDGAQPFDPAISIATPAIGAGFTDVINFIVPNGYEGVIQRYANQYNGGGFIQGSGQLIWRMLRNGQAIRNYDNILLQFGFGGLGGTTNGIRLQSADKFQFQVSNVSLVSGGTQITCYVGGYFYPKKTGGAK